MPAKICDNEGMNSACLEMCQLLAINFAVRAAGDLQDAGVGIFYPDWFVVATTDSSVVKYLKYLMALDWNDKGTVDLEALTAFDVKCRCSNHRLLFLTLKPLASLNPWCAQRGFLVGLIKHHPNSQSEGSVDKRESWTDLPPKSSSCGGVR